MFVQLIGLCKRGFHFIVRNFYLNSEDFATVLPFTDLDNHVSFCVSMRILGIESSCDETAIALVRNGDDGFVVEENMVSSQVDIHALYGGVVPEVAAREHASHIFPLLLRAGIPRSGEGIDVVAVTQGPGLVPALRIGVELGKALSWSWGKPLVGVNHLEGHIYSVWLGEQKSSQLDFPALVLLVSGGHTELVLMNGHGDYELIGMTRDDAAGEAFDKVAKMLDLGYPGGPEISMLAQSGDPEAIPFPRPMIESGDFDFSFSGLKTAVSVYLKEHPDAYIPDVAASFQAAVIETLVVKTLKAVDDYAVSSVILSGGVSANKELREKLATSLQDHGIAFSVPQMKFTTDNAAMIAAAGYFRAQQKDYVDPLKMTADPNMRLA